MKKLLLLFVFLLGGYAYSNWISVGNPISNVKSMVKSDTKIFAACYGVGITAYDLDGQDWSTYNTDLANVNVWKAIAVGKDLFAATEGGIFKLTNFTGAWKKVSASSGTFYSLATNGTKLYALNDNNQVYLTTNSGTDWTEVNTIDIGYTIRTLEVNNNNLYLGCETGKLYKTTDDGTTWNEINNAPLLFDITDIKFINNSIFVATNNGGMFFSNDGLKWNSINNGISASDILTIFTVDGKNIFIGTVGNGVYFTNNNGTSWIEANEGMDKSNCMAFSTDGTYLYVANSNSDVMRRKLTEFNANVLESPILNTPANDAGDVELNTMFTWGTAKGAVFYHLMISKANDFATNVLNIDNVSKTYYTPTVLENEIVYYWKVAAVSATDEKKWSETRKFTTVKFVSVEEELNNSITIYPNPASEYLAINSKELNIDFVNIYSITGELVCQNQISGNTSFKIDLSTFKNGSYFANIKIDGKIFEYKFVVSK